MPVIQKTPEALHLYAATPAVGQIKNPKAQRPAGTPGAPSPSFAAIMDAAKQEREQPVAPEAQAAAPPLSADSAAPIIKLGKIDNKTAPTVSHLLRGHADFQSDYWNIIFSDINKGKPFESMREGTEVSINTSTNEIIWDAHPMQNMTVVEPESVATELVTEDGQIIIGTVDKENPTVSHLLKKHRIYSDDTWNIIFSPINKNKAYSLIREGTRITINPKTFELSLSNKAPSQPQHSEQISAAAKQTLSDMSKDFFSSDNSFSRRLAESVKPFIGRPYNEIDCYGLLVRGIRSQGVMYGGKGGLREHLEQQASEQGLPLNAFQNGEGLIESVGNQVFRESFIQVQDAARQAESTYEDMKAHLSEGAILSFSTPSRGHTGIISRKDGQWTYINSGLIDNQVDSGKIMHRVGEESLAAEIGNWFELAQERGESLKISLGQLDERKLQAYMRTDERDLLTKTPQRQHILE